MPTDFPQSYNHTFDFPQFNSSPHDPSSNPEEHEESGERNLGSDNMGSIQNTVHYCCVWKDGRVLYAYSGGGDDEVENLAELCLEKAPCHHKWYFETMFKKTFGFLMEDGYIYFAIVDENLGNPGSLKFLEHVRDEFKKLAKKGSSRSVSNLNSLVLHDQLVPVIRRLITSLEHVAETSFGNDGNGQIDIGVSTKAPLLGKHRTMSDHVISVGENVVLEDHLKAEDKRGGIKSDSKSQGGSMAVVKEVSLIRSRSSAQTVRNKWCRQVRIVLAVDVAVCLILFVVWMVVCRGTKCIS